LLFGYYRQIVLLPTGKVIEFRQFFSGKKALKFIREKWVTSCL